MDTPTRLPGIDAARDVLGLGFAEIAAAVLTDPCTLDRWRQGVKPTPVSIGRLEVLSELVDEVQRTMHGAIISDWIEREVDACDGLNR
jgi:hypothetical protein